MITPDLTPEEAGPWLAAADAHRLDPVFLVAPSSTEERIARITSLCRGFVYATSVMGVTGARQQTSAAAPVLVRRVRAATDLPIGVGLGVSDGDQAAEVAGYADAVIVGSAFVRAVLDAPEGGKRPRPASWPRTWPPACGRPAGPLDGPARGDPAGRGRRVGAAGSGEGQAGAARRLRSRTTPDRPAPQSSTAACAVAVTPAGSPSGPYQPRWHSRPRSLSTGSPDTASHRNA